MHNFKSPLRENRFRFLFLLSALLFSVGTIGTEITQINVRFALMIDDMARHGVGVFATSNAVPYCDYFSPWIFCSYLTTLGGRCVTLFTMSLPAILLGAFTVAMTARIGDSIRPDAGSAAALLLLITPEFLDLFTGIGIDVPVMAAGVAMLYLLQRETHVWKTGAWFALLLFLSFAMRGPFGLVLLGAAVAGFLLAARAWRKVLIFGAIGAGTTLFCAALWRGLILHQGGEELWQWFVQHQFLGRMDQGREGFTIILDVLGSLAPVSLAALAVFFRPRRELLAPPVVGWLGFPVLVILLLAMPSRVHIRYMAILMPCLALLGGYAWSGGLPARFAGIVYKKLPARLHRLIFLLGAAAVVLLAAIGVALGPAAQQPYGHYLAALLLLAGCAYLKMPLPERCRWLLAVGIVLTTALQPFLAARENSASFVKEVEKFRTGTLWLYRMGPDHDDLKYILHMAREKRAQVRRVFPARRSRQKMYDMMYPVEILSECLDSIRAEDVIIVEDHPDDLNSLEEILRRHGRRLTKLRAGNLGHRRFLAVRLEAASPRSPTQSAKPKSVQR